MNGFNIDLEKETLTNDDFRRVLYTGKNSQLVLMSLKPGEEIGSEVHDDIDQFFRFEDGQGKVVIDGREIEVIDGSGIVVPAGAEHNVINTSEASLLKLYTVYSPPEHKNNTVHKTKEEAEADTDHHFDGVVSES